MTRLEKPLRGRARAASAAQQTEIRVFPPVTPLHPKTTDGSRREEGAEGPHLPHGLVPVAPEALADALHAELELLEAVVPDHPAVVGLLARRGRDEVLGCKTGGGHAGSGSAGGSQHHHSPCPTQAPQLHTQRHLPKHS